MSETNIQSIYLLADHLDAALATGEDLLKENMELTRFTPDTPSDDMREAHSALRDFVDRVRMLELRLCARIVRARDLAGEVSALDQRLEPFARMFASGTVALIDAMADLGDTTDQDFETGAQALAYLRSRAFVAPDAVGCEDIQELRSGEDILISTRVRVGTLLDLVATFLDAVEQHHDIYGDKDTDEVAAEAQATTPTQEAGAAEKVPAMPAEKLVREAITEPEASKAVVAPAASAVPVAVTTSAEAAESGEDAAEALKPAAETGPAAASSKQESAVQQPAEAVEKVGADGDIAPDTDVATATASKTASKPRKSSSLMERLKLAS